METWADVASPTGRSRRRAVVFFCALFFALAGSLTYVYTRPAEYRAMARLKIAPAAVVTQPADAKNAPTVATDAKAFLTEVQVLTSRPLLQSVFHRLEETGSLPDLGPDPIGELQQMLHAEPVAGTQVVELSARSHDQALVARLVNAVSDEYRQHVAEVYRGSATSTYGEVNDEVVKLGQEMRAKRQAVDAFRAQYDIVSMENKENDVLAQIGGLSQSYTDAKNRRAKAQAHLQALQSSAAAGKAVIRTKDDPILADIEQRASVLREQWQELQRRVTPAYLAMDQNAKSLQARLEIMETQLKAQRAASERAALAEAQEELSAAQSAAEKLRQDVADNQKQAQEFATHLNEYKVLRQDLDHLEEMHRAALDRLAKLQASEQERAPRVELVERATASTLPWRPDYRRDALIAIAASIGFGLFAVWFTDFIAGAPTTPTIPAMMMVQHSWARPPSMLSGGTIIEPLSLANAGHTGQLPPPAALPRHLDDAEIVALVGAVTEDARLAVLGLLSGLNIDELVALRWDQIDLSAGIINIASEHQRGVALEEPLRGLLDARCRLQTAAAAGTVLRSANGSPLGLEEAEQLIIYGAHDAGLDRPQEVTSQALRYTWLSFLLQQGIRAADVFSLAGRVPHNDLVAYMQMHSPKAKQPLDQIDRVLPALRELTRKGIA
jgi:uncharacterized protein involved in exopolysaccharide biosynthesis